MQQATCSQRCYDRFRRARLPRSRAHPPPAPYASDRPRRPCAAPAVPPRPERMPRVRPTGRLGRQPAQGLHPPRRLAPLRSAPPRAGPARRQLPDRPRRVRRDPRAERLGEVDARPPALDTAPARRRQRRSVRHRRVREASGRAAPGQPGVRRGVVLQTHVAGREPQLLRPVLRTRAAPDPRTDPADPAAGRLPAGAARRADGGPVAGHAAEGRAGPRAADLAGAAAAGRADHRARSALQARGAGIHPPDARRARRHDPALHPRHGRGRGARRPDRDPPPRRAAVPGQRRRDQAPVRRRRARAGVPQRHRPGVRGRGRRRSGGGA